MSDQEEKLQQFTAITGASADRAKFFLENASWNVEMAMASFYENDDDDIEFIEETSPQPVPTSHEPVPDAKPIRNKSSKIATINTFTKSADKNEEEGQAYYAGGSEHSGQQVLGPPKNRDIIADMFKSVQEHGVEVLEPGSTSSGSSNRVFKGTGYKLGQDDSSSEVVQGQQEQAHPQEVTLRLWQNGFNLNDGPLREYTDPSNKEFLDSIRRGEIPHELRKGSTEVHLAMEDHRMDTYKTPKVKSKPFQGQGYMLGSPAPVVIEGQKDEDMSSNEARAKEVVNLDDSKPVTSLQIRLADGSKLVGQFNHDHTVATIRNFISTARPQYQTQHFNLLSSFPSKVLNESVTIKDAGLLNSAIMQKLV